MSRRHAIRIAFAILAVGFFATPILARMVGVTAESFENRRFADPPKLSQGWDAFGQTTRFLTDRMPLRAQAVRANTRIWTDVFDATPRYGQQAGLAQDAALPGVGGVAQGAEPSEPAVVDTAAQVLRGRDGWLFVHAEMNSSCAPALPFPEALASWRSLLATIRANGSRALLVVPPDKGTINPEHVAMPECATVGKRRLWSLLERAERPADLIALRDDLLRLKRDAGDDLYARKDSHWTTAGSLALVRAVLDGIGDGVKVRADEVRDPGRGKYTGDLTNLLGAPEEDTQAQRGIERDPAAPRIPGRTILIGDSYSQGPVPQLTPYFEDLRVLSWVETPVPELARELRAADTVLLETVERELTYRAADVVRRLERRLKG